MTSFSPIPLKSSRSCQAISTARHLRKLTDLLLLVACLLASWFTLDFALQPVKLTRTEQTFINRQTQARTATPQKPVDLQLGPLEEQSLWLAYSDWTLTASPNQGHCTITAGKPGASLRCQGYSAEEADSTRFVAQASIFSILSQRGHPENDSVALPITNQQCQPPKEQPLAPPEGRFEGEFKVRHFDPRREVWE